MTEKRFNNERRWKIINHEVIDLETGQIFTKKDDAYLHILNVIYSEIRGNNNVER